MKSVGALLLLVSLIAIPARPAFAQGMQPQTHVTKRIEPPGTIHGSEHPELIPDLTAYRLFFIVAAIPSDANEHRVQRQHVLLAGVGLSPIDQLAMSSALSIFHSEYAMFLDKYSRQQPDDKTVPERDGIVRETLERLRGALSAQGFTALDRFIQQEKTKITRVSAPHAHHAT